MMEDRVRHTPWPLQSLGQATACVGRGRGVVGGKRRGGGERGRAHWLTGGARAQHSARNWPLTALAGKASVALEAAALASGAVAQASAAALLIVVGREGVQGPAVARGAGTKAAVRALEVTPALADIVVAAHAVVWARIWGGGVERRGEGAQR